MFMAQYTEQWAALDLIAERIRALGEPAPGTYKEFSKLTSIKEVEGTPKEMDMVKHLVKAQEATAKTARKLFPLVEKEKWSTYRHVKFIDKVDDVKPFLEDADCMVLPSYYREGTPRSVLEALAVGRPIITTHMPGCKETVEEGINGYLCEPKDVNSLSDAMEKILLASFEDLLRMGQHSRRMAEEKYDENIIFNLYTKHISALINSKS